jgi:hypothetical protein
MLFLEKFLGTRTSLMVLHYFTKTNATFVAYDKLFLEKSIGTHFAYSGSLA